MNNVVIVIVNWNTGNLLAKCLQSLYELPEKDIITKVIVVDNASSDDSLEKSKNVTDKTIATDFIESKKNLGFAGANNLAISELLSDMEFADNILLLNPDTEVRPGAIKAINSVLLHNPEAGIVGPKLLNTNLTIQPSVRAFPSLTVFIAMMLKLPRLLNSFKFWQQYTQRNFDYNKQQEVEQVMGAAFLITYKVAHELGGLDEKYWIWFEEVDYCKQAHDAGWRIIYTPQGQIIHHGGVSFNQVIGPKRVLPFLNSLTYYAKKHLGFTSWLILLILWPASLALSIPASFIHMKFKRDNKKRLHGE